MFADRGVMFVTPTEKVYSGQIVGEHNRDNDLVVNVTEMKPLTNMRASGSDSKAAVKPPKIFSMEMALEYIEDDELVVVTPETFRLRKIFLKENDRKRSERQRV